MLFASLAAANCTAHVTGCAAPSALASLPCCMSVLYAVILMSRSEEASGGHGTSWYNMLAGGASTKVAHLLAHYRVYAVSILSHQASPNSAGCTHLSSWFRHVRAAAGLLKPSAPFRTPKHPLSIYLSWCAGWHLWGGRHSADCWASNS